MDRAPKRIPGERNPTPSADGPSHVGRESWMGAEHVRISGAIIAFLDWRKRRKAVKRRR